MAWIKSVFVFQFPEAFKLNMISYVLVFIYMVALYQLYANGHINRREILRKSFVALMFIKVSIV